MRRASGGRCGASAGAARRLRGRTGPPERRRAPGLAQVKALGRSLPVPNSGPFPWALMFPFCAEIIINPTHSFYAICSPNGRGLRTCGLLPRYRFSRPGASGILAKPQVTGLRLPASQPDPPRPMDGASVPARAGVAAAQGEGEARAAARSPAAPGGGGGGSRRGPAPGLWPGEMRRGREAGGGGWGQRISPRPAPSLTGRPCVSAAYVRIFSSALRFGSCVSSYLSGLFPSAAIKKQWKAGGSRPRSPGDAK